MSLFDRRVLRLVESNLCMLRCTGASGGVGGPQSSDTHLLLPLQYVQDVVHATHLSKL